jgi:uncharacterized membrane protein
MDILTYKHFIIAFFLIPLIDAPWLYFTSTESLAMFKKIQGVPVRISIAPTIVVYIALAYLLIQQTSVYGAFLNGMAVYAVYDFTNLAIFKDYTLKMALMDTAWGGVLFATGYYILSKI